MRQNHPKTFMESMADCCNSQAAFYLSTAVVILALLLGIGGCDYLFKLGEAEIYKAKATRDQ